MEDENKAKKIINRTIIIIIIALGPSYRNYNLQKYSN